LRGIMIGKLLGGRVGSRLGSRINGLSELLMLPKLLKGLRNYVSRLLRSKIGRLLGLLLWRH
jgi:hypothetical protein